MRTITFILLLTLGSLALHSQTQKILSYQFNNSLAESKGLGPTLISIDSAGTFVVDTLKKVDGMTKTVYRFKKNCGVQFNNKLAANFLDTTYTIELYFKFDDLNGYRPEGSGWRRVIDWKDRTTDYGAYVYYGALSFYDYFTSDSVTVFAGEYTHYVVTRNGVTKNLRMYSDAKTEVNFTDSYNDGVIDSSNVLNFFADDLVVTNEASSGAVALLNIYNYVLDSATIKHKFDSLQGELFAVRELGNKKSPIRVYPNPASDNVNIDLSQFYTNEQVFISLINSTGSIVYNRPYPAGSNYRVDLKTITLPNGIYLVKVESSTDIYYQKVIIRR